MRTVSRFVAKAAEVLKQSRRAGSMFSPSQTGVSRGFPVSLPTVSKRASPGSGLHVDEARARR